MKKVSMLILSFIAILTFVACGNKIVETGKTNSESKGKETVLYFVRHGKTMFNATGQIQGWADTPLTDEGIEGAENLGEGLKGTIFAAAYSSDLGRAVATAEYVLENSDNKDVPLKRLVGLREWGYGGYEGRDNAEMWDPIFEKHNLTFDEEWTQYGELTKILSDENIANEIAKNDATRTAETYGEIIKRTKDAMTTIINETSENGGNILIVSHGSEIPTILEVIAPGSYDGENIGNCSVTKVTYKDGNYTVDIIGDDSYLK
ncbi:MAG: histidine phosphatase family protein [Vagococcus fluvialis]